MAGCEGFQAECALEIPTSLLTGLETALKNLGARGGNVPLYRPSRHSQESVYIPFSMKNTDDPQYVF